MMKTLFVACFCGALTACSGDVTSAEGAGGSGASSGTGAPSGSGTSSGSGSSGTGGSGECVPQAGTGGFMEPTCEDLDVLAISNPVITDEDGDGLVESGEGATLQVNLDEVAGVGFSWYPGVTFESDNPGATVASEDWFYAIGACQTLPVTATAKFSVPAGTTVTITARVGMLNTNCPDTYSLDIPIEIH